MELAPKIVPSTQTISVAIIEDQQKVRDGLAVLIGGTEGYRFTGAYGSVEEAIPMIARDTPEVLLIDLGLPGMSGIDGIRELKKRHPSAQVLVLTVFSDDARIFEALCAGACGYLLKTMAPARLLESIQEAKAGGAPMSPEVARRVIQLFRQFRPPQLAGCGLTPHEARVLKLLADGHNYQTAAAELGISVNTIRFYVRACYGKLQVHSKSEAVAKALRQGIIR